MSAEQSCPFLHSVRVTTATSSYAIRTDAVFSIARIAPSTLQNKHPLVQKARLWYSIGHNATVERNEWGYIRRRSAAGCEGEVGLAYVSLCYSLTSMAESYTNMPNGPSGGRLQSFRSLQDYLPLHTIGHGETIITCSHLAKSYRQKGRSHDAVRPTSMVRPRAQPL